MTNNDNGHYVDTYICKLNYVRYITKDLGQFLKYRGNVDERRNKNHENNRYINQ